MLVLFALLAAAGWGSSDFVAGNATRRSSAVSVVILTHLASFGALFAISLVPGQGGAPGGSDIVWGLAAGFAGGMGAMLLFRGLGRGSMSVVAPVTATGAALVPVAVGLARGESLGTFGLVGVLLAVGAIVLVSLAGADPDATSETSTDGVDGADGADGAVELDLHQPVFVPDVPPVGAPGTPLPPPPPATAVALAPMPPPATMSDGGVAVLTRVAPPPPPPMPPWLVEPRPVQAEAETASPAETPVGRSLATIMKQPGMSDALLSGLGFGLFFVFISQTSEAAGHWPLVIARFLSAAMFAAIAIMSFTPVFPERDSRPGVIVAGLLDAAAAVFFVLSTRSGLLSVGAVLASLYPAVTVLLARFVTGERITRTQLGGLILAGFAVSLLAL